MVRLVKNATRRWVVIGVTLCTAAAGGVALWQLNKQQSLLPDSVVKKIGAFTPYFYNQRIPAGYSLDREHTVYDHNVLIVTLTQASDPSVVITEQPLPSDLPEDIAFKGDKTEKVETTNGKAVMNDVEGRLVGTMITNDRTTLIIINTTHKTYKNDMVALLQGLVALR